MATLNGMRQWPHEARRLILDAPDEGARVDILGTMREVEKGLAEERRLAMTEIETGTTGDEFTVTQGFINERSYNSTSLLQQFADAYGQSLLATIGTLKRLGVLELKWNWTPLKNEAASAGVSYSTVQHEVIDGEDFDIGVNRKPGYPSFKRIDKEA